MAVAEVKLGFKAVIEMPDVELELEDELLPVPVVVGFVMDGGRRSRRPMSGLEALAVTAAGVATDFEAVGVLSCTSAGTRRLALGLPSPVTRLYVAGEVDPAEPLLELWKLELDNWIEARHCALESDPMPFGASP